MGSFNVMKHGFVPEHHLVPKEDEEDILKELEIDKQNLPKILKSDPVIEQMEKVHGDIEEGRMVEVVRESPTAGVAKVYRLIISR
ncbi:MAG: DNA-directed RNA polymerase subunit H [Candidatus Saliniplasma sp.]